MFIRILFTILLTGIFSFTFANDTTYHHPECVFGSTKIDISHNLPDHSFDTGTTYWKPNTSGGGSVQHYPIS